MGAEVMAGCAGKFMYKWRYLSIINVTAVLLDKRHWGLGHVSLAGTGGAEKGKGMNSQHQKHPAGSVGVVEVCGEAGGERQRNKG